MSSNRINSRWRRSRRSGIPFPPKPSTKSAYKNKMNKNKTTRINRRTNKNSLRKKWANSLKGKSPLPKARSPRKKSPMEISNDYEELKGILKIKTGWPDKIFPNAPSADSMSKLRDSLIFVKDKKVIKLIKDDMVRILVNYKGISRINQKMHLDDYLHGQNYEGKRLFSKDEIANYMKLFKMNKKQIQDNPNQFFNKTD